MKKLVPWTLLLALVALARPALGACPAPFNTCIDVDWALDPDPTLNYTCTYCATPDPPDDCTSGLFFPAQGPLAAANPSADGRCSLRRALREAGARPAGDRPILIRFDNLATGGAACTSFPDQNSCDDQQQVGAAGQWLLFIEGNSDRFKLGDVGVGINLGQVVIRGPALLANGMPQVFLDGTQAPGSNNQGLGNNPFTFGIHMSNNIIERLGFLRGGDFIVVHSGSDNQTLRNNTFGLHPDGDQILHIDPGDLDASVGASALAGNNGVLVLTNTDNVTVEDSFFAGMEVAAVQVNGGTTNVVVQNNHVGTRIDGSVPVVPLGLQCNTYPLNPVPNPNSLDAGSWYGGDGIDVSGTGALITGNIVAGLHTHRSAGVLEPIAIRAQGDTHTVQNNLIGIGDDGYAAGVCGSAIHYGGDGVDGHQILDNAIHRPRMTINFDGPINWIDTTATGIPDGGSTVQRNTVTDAPSPHSPAAIKVLEMGPNIQPSIKGFEPAEVTSINGTQVLGRACPGSPCASCIIDLYKDDNDGRNETLEHLGTATADASGNFSFTLAAPLDPGFGIRTMTTSVAADQIGNGIDDQMAAGTTTEESSDDPFDQCAGLYLPSGCAAQIDLTGTIGGMQTYTAQNTITTANATFDGTANVTLTAGQSIEVGNETVFATGSEATLNIDPGACP